MTAAGIEVRLREVVNADLERFFAHMQDKDSVYQAAFMSDDPADRGAFESKWQRIRSNEQITVRTILAADAVAGHIASFVMEGDLEITYWVGREFQGQQVATRALDSFLRLMAERPLHGRAAADNSASIRVLEKCGFSRIGQARAFARARSKEIDEVILRLDV